MPLLDAVEQVEERSYHVQDVVSSYCVSPTGLRDELVLTAWLLVLLRSQDLSDVRFAWRYESPSISEDDGQDVHVVLASDVISSMENHLGQVSATLSGLVTNIVSGRSDSPRHKTSIRLSTNQFPGLQAAGSAEDVIVLDISAQHDLLQVRPVSYTNASPAWTVSLIMDTLVDAIDLCVRRPHATVSESLRPSQRDMDIIWGWNHNLPPKLDYCMHDVISKQARLTPTKVAVSSWDGDLTYGEIDLCSNRLAHRLHAEGVQLHDFVPLCFEKSKWTIVAVLAIMKVGGTLVMMDPSLPLARLQNMAIQTKASIIVSSRQQLEFSRTILSSSSPLVVDQDCFPLNAPDENISDLPTVPSSALMYLIFTSGSTGTPKGVKISHQTYTSSAVPRARAVGYNGESRVLDFASYAFDVSIDSMLLTLGNGGCLCIPSDDERMNDINSAIRRMRVNYAGLTPSVARILDADVIASLEGLGLGGEAASPSDVNHWGKSARIIIGYGPCECTIGCTINGDTATGRPYISIGTGNGAAIWIVDPNDHEKLLPVGAVGELLVEGPIVGQGYLDDDDKTAAAFIEPPSWLRTNHKHYLGRTSGRLYKTGDLGKYDPDGSGGIIFAGRKDTQVKLRGQRVELGEIESQLLSRLPGGTNVIAEVIRPLASGGQPTLVAFIKFPDSQGPKASNVEQVPIDDELSQKLEYANSEITKTLPRYMIPTAYIPLNLIPVLISGKTDRKVLRRFGESVNLQTIEQTKPKSEVRQLNEKEFLLRGIWVEILKLDAEKIGFADNFFSLGGDSLAAMKLVPACRARNIDLSVVNIFAHPVLSSMANVMQIHDFGSSETLLPFSLVNLPSSQARTEAAQQCGCEESAIQDVYPCTPTQESLFTFALRSPDSYIAQRIARIPEKFSIDKWTSAWEKVMRSHAILRTRLAQLSCSGLQQVVLDDTIAWGSASDLQHYLKADSASRFELGQSLSRYAIVQDQASDTTYMVWTIHHVLYDGWSEPMILRQVAEHLSNSAITESSTRMLNFAKYLSQVDSEKSKQFWREDLEGAIGPQYPRLPSRDYISTSKLLTEKLLKFKASANNEFTKATIIRGAWALLASQHCHSNDMVFGETLTGRDIPVPGVENIVGPLIATIPMRVYIDRGVSVREYLRSVQNMVLSRIPYQHAGWQNIRKVSQDAQFACEAGTGLVFQPEVTFDGTELGFQLGDPVKEALHFNPYPLMLAFGLRDDALRVCASFDPTLISGAQMNNILLQLEATCENLMYDLTRHVSEVSSVSAYDLEQIWTWNRSPPLCMDDTAQHRKADSIVQIGSIYPRVANPWVCSPYTSSLLAPTGSVGELWLEYDGADHKSGESPTWLLEGYGDHSPGRHGRLVTTGDLVYQQVDGTIRFYGRKDSHSGRSAQGLQTSQLNDLVRRQLSQSKFAITTYSEDGSSVQQPLLFIEQPRSSAKLLPVLATTIEINVPHHNGKDYRIKILGSISADLSTAIKEVDRKVRNSLPPRLLPTAYVVVDRLPLNQEEHIDEACLQDLAKRLSTENIRAIQSGMRRTWLESLASTIIGRGADVLRTAWSEVLKTPADDIDVDDNFFRLGGDSVLAMKLVSKLRAQGHQLTVADIFKNMRLSDAARVIKLDYQKHVFARDYRPFQSLRGIDDVKGFVDNLLRPRLEHGWIIEDVLSVTEMQTHDVKATISRPRTSIQYTMLLMNKTANTTRLISAYQDLVRRHSILRTAFVQHDPSYYQVVLGNFRPDVKVQKVKACQKQDVHRLCVADAEREITLGRPFTEAFIYQDETGEIAFVLRLSHAQYDGVSLPLLLGELEALYRGATLGEPVAFSEYFAAINNASVVQNARDYWRNLLRDSSWTPVDQHQDLAHRRTGRFESQACANIANSGHTTSSTLLTTAWAIVLARAKGVNDVVFGAVTSGRSVDVSNVDRVMGPCYNIMPVRVRIDSGMTVETLLESVQAQIAASATHDFLGFGDILRNCTAWDSSLEFYDSIVHHQDIDDSDDMSFAGMSCGVDIVNPDGDAADPFKVVSFVRNGELNVGVVGNADRPGHVEATLKQVAQTIRELTGSTQALIKL